MIGTIINSLAILISSIIGSLVKKGLGEKYQVILYNSMGLAACAIGLNAIISNMSNSKYPVLFIVSLTVGGIIGTALNLSENFDNLTQKFSKSNLSQGLSTAIIISCVGSLSILGPIESAVHGNITYLLTNATLDFITMGLLASTYGIGIAFTSIVLFVWQGSIYLGASFLINFLTPELMCEITLIGGFLIAASGLSILKIKDINSINLLPALLVPPIWFALISIF